MFLGSKHEQRAPKPRHPDYDRWMLGFFTLMIVLAALFGDAGLRAIERADKQLARSMLDYAALLAAVMQGVRWTAGGIVALLVVQVVWVCGLHPVVYRMRLQRTRGHYEGIILPKPDTARRTVGGSSNPDAAHAYWDRVIGMLHNAATPGTTPYLAAELWGGPTGRVRWGYYLPDSIATERLTLRGLITANRDTARLVPQPDPFLAALTARPEDASDMGTRYLACALLQLGAPDYLPLVHDGLMLPGLAAALQTGREVEAAGVSVIVSPAPATWARRVHMLVDRWRWIMRYRRSHDTRWREEIDTISLKVQQPHARCCIRVQVIARTKGAAETRCRAVCSTFTANRKRHRRWTQGWAIKQRRSMRITGGRLPLAWQRRAPMRVLPGMLPLFPLT